MSRRALHTLFALIFLLSSAACSAQPASPADPTPNKQIPNPASANCEQNGGKLDIRTDSSGGQVGYCVFPDGSECEEWAYFRGDCKPADSLAPAAPTALATAAPAAVSSAYDGWNKYQNEESGFSFYYPPESTLDVDRANPAVLTISGPVVNSESWPSIRISFPADRDGFHPTEGADLEKWLTDHFLLMSGTQEPAAEVRQPGLKIAGEMAIHTRFERSPQSYAYDKYFFAHAGQLYEIVIGHSGDKEDWDLYNLFLESIQFDE